MLEETIRTAFKRHIEDRGGLITAPEKLLSAVLAEVSAWLKTNEQKYRKAGSAAEANALRDLRATLKKS